MRHLYTVSADHSSPEYVARAKPVLVTQDKIDGSWCATTNKLGCGKSYGTIDAAIRGLFQDHACHNIAIIGPIKSGEYITLSNVER